MNTQELPPFHEVMKFGLVAVSKLDETKGEILHFVGYPAKPELKDVELAITEMVEDKEFGIDLDAVEVRLATAEEIEKYRAIMKDDAAGIAAEEKRLGIRLDENQRY